MSFLDAILAKIQEAGFMIAFSKELTLTKEQAQEFYKELKDKDYYDSLCTRMSSGPMLALCLAREFAVEKWREVIGPTSVEQAKEESPERYTCVLYMYSIHVHIHTYMYICIACKCTSALHTIHVHVHVHVCDTLVFDHHKVLKVGVDLHVHVDTCSH